ncbi:hypothetical protein RQP46_009959 [Phenoliferia psychrophenolica]
MASKRARSASLSQGLADVPLPGAQATVPHAVSSTKASQVQPPRTATVLEDLRSFRWTTNPATSLKLIVFTVLAWASLQLVLPEGTTNPLSHALFISYPLPETPNDAGASRYGKGVLDIAFLAFYIVVWSFIRQGVTEYLLRPLAAWAGLKSDAKQARFMEQGYAIVYFMMTSSLGLYVMTKNGSWFYNTKAYWIDYPHWRMRGEAKYYYLLQARLLLVLVGSQLRTNLSMKQAAYWLQQILVLGLRLEKPRSDYYQLIIHHIVTLWLIGWSYAINLTVIGNSVFISMDIPDIFLAASKCLNYVGLQHTSEVSFVALLLVWTYMRHYLNCVILWSVWTEFDLIPAFYRTWTETPGAPTSGLGSWWLFTALNSGRIPAWIHANPDLLDSLANATGVRAVRMVRPLAVGFLLSTPVETTSIEAALWRVSDKWRLIAGRLERDEEGSGWVVRVPIDDTFPSDYARYRFTSTTTSPPPFKYFVPPGAPRKVADLAKANAALVAIHVTTFADCQAIGLTAPHGVFDAIGLGMIIKALDAELTGKEWTPPPLLEKNSLDERLQASAIECTKLPPYVADAELRRLSNGSEKSRWDMFRLVWSLLVEKFWHRVKARDVFVGRELMERLVESVKEEVRVATAGREWVSTGDVLMAWSVKAMYGSETSNNKLLTTTALWDTRGVLSTPTTSLSSYPHNTACFYIMQPIKVSTLAATPLSTLALQARRALDAARTLPALHDTLDWMCSYLPLPARGNEAEGIYFSNQIAGHLTGTSWGAKPDALVGWWIWCQELDHIVAWNELESGWIMSTITRPSRWKSVEKELERLKSTM